MSKYYLSILSFYLIFAPYLRLPGLRFHDSQRIWQLLVISTVSLCLIYQWYWQKKETRKIALSIPSNTLGPYLLGGLFLSGLISVFLAEYVAYALLEFSFIFLLVLLIIALSSVDQKNLQRLGRYIFITAVLYSSFYTIIFIGNYITSFLNPMVLLWPNKITYSISFGDVTVTGKDILYFSNKRFFNHTQTWTFPILICAVLFYKKRIDRWFRVEVVLLFILTSIWWLLVFASGGRGTLIAVIASSILVLLLFKNKAVSYVKTCFSTLFTGLAGYLFFYIYLPGGREAEVLRFTDNNRFDLWQNALGLWLENPIFGIGPMHYAVREGLPEEAHPHNFFVQFLTEWGILSFMLLACLLFIFARSTFKLQSMRKFQQSNFIVVIAMYASIGAALIHSLVSGVMHTPMSQMWLVPITAWILAWNHKNDMKYYNKHLIATLLLLLNVTILVLTIPIIDDLSAGYFEYIEKFRESKLCPRFWDQSLIPF